MSLSPPENERLFTKVRGLIDAARRRAAASVNAELTLLYWQVGRHLKQPFSPASGRPMAKR